MKQTLLFTISILFTLSLATAQLSLPYTQDFETATIGTIQTNTTNISGLVGWDYEKTVNGRLRTAAGTGFYNSGMRALTLDASPNGTVSDNFIIAHLDLSNYSTAADVVLLDFAFAHHGEESHPNDKVWIRGNNTDAWVEIYDWFVNKGSNGIYKTAADINLSAALSGAGQNFSATTELRFGQTDNFEAASPTSSDGLSIDDIFIHVLEANDVGVIAILDPTGTTCGSSSTSITVVIENFGSSPQAQLDVLVHMNGAITGSAAAVSTQTLAYGEKDTIVVNGLNTSAGGVVTLNATTVLGGDADINNNTTSYTLTFNATSSGIDVVTACDTFTWTNGVTYTASNTSALDTFQNVIGCDSIVTLNLTINNSSTSTDVITACDTYTWTDGVTYTASNTTALDTFQNAAGCDSIVTLDLTINNSNTSTDVVTACDAYTWSDGITYTANNTTALDTFQNAAGCDSIVTLNLTINNSSMSTDVITACDTYTWTDGNTYTASNTTALDTFQNAVGCDSIVTLNLTINNSSTSTDVITVCDTYTWTDGITYTASNTTALDTFQNTAGCDSIVTLNLSINNSVSTVSTLTITSGDSIYAGGAFQTTSGSYYDTLMTTQSCDSIVNTVLTVVTGINDVLAFQLNVYPNPFTDVLSITSDHNLKSIKLYDIKGKLVKSIALNSNNNTVNTSDLETGLYFYTITDFNNQMVKGKLIK